MWFLMNGAPFICGKHYFIYKRRMEFYLEAEGIGIWKSVLTGYTPPKKVKTTTHKKKRGIIQ